ncbi:hypothetical protein Tsubulata_036552 [Turnera subulata]|uniref:Uncharacterized protein n=1 Tax=Turnera subulata TaxID=218843 RepID=A0A9Q0F6L8_9ROSI|nr:hypothetical protein Tsubulata_036552 [Turnera subulata]
MVICNTCALHIAHGLSKIRVDTLFWGPKERPMLLHQDKFTTEFSLIPWFQVLFILTYFFVQSKSMSMLTVYVKSGIQACSKNAMYALVHRLVIFLMISSTGSQSMVNDVTVPLTSHYMQISVWSGRGISLKDCGGVENFRRI